MLHVFFTESAALLECDLQKLQPNISEAKVAAYTRM